MTPEAWGQTGDKNSQCGQASAEERGEGGEGPRAEQQAAKKTKITKGLLWQRWPLLGEMPSALDRARPAHRRPAFRRRTGAGEAGAAGRWVPPPGTRHVSANALFPCRALGLPKFCLGSLLALLPNAALLSPARSVSQHPSWCRTPGVDGWTRLRASPLSTQHLEPAAAAVVDKETETHCPQGDCRLGLKSVPPAGWDREGFLPAAGSPLSRSWHSGCLVGQRTPMETTGGPEEVCRGGGAPRGIAWLFFTR